MMRLSTMWQVDRRLTHGGTSPLATALAKPWEPDSDPVFVRTSANAVFRFHHRGDLRYLRFRPVDEQRGRDTAAELAFMAGCGAAGLCVPTPVPGADGTRVHRAVVEGRLLDAVVLTPVPGEERAPVDLDAPCAAVWGGLVARVQAVGRDLAPAQDLVRHLAGDRGQVDLAGHNPAVKRELDTLRMIVGAWPRTPTDFGLVHGDVELDNLRWSGDQLGVFDFDACRYTWYGIDVAAAMDDIADLPELAAAFLDGYEAAGGAPLRDRLDVCRRWVALETYLSIAHALDLRLDAQEHPDWLHDLHRRLERRQQAYVDALHPRPEEG